MCVMYISAMQTSTYQILLTIECLLNVHIRLTKKNMSEIRDKFITNIITHLCQYSMSICFALVKWKYACKWASHKLQTSFNGDKSNGTILIKFKDKGIST